MASLLPRLGPASTACRSCRLASLSSILDKSISPIASFNAPSVSLTIKRTASHKQQGAVNGPKQGPGKRLGAKKSGEQYVIPGNIIFRQRGTLWFPGTNAGMGRDHTIYATESGYVKFYRDPARHPKRKYIGVAWERDDALPYPTNAPRRRRLGMVAVPLAPAPPSKEDAVDIVTLRPNNGDASAATTPPRPSTTRTATPTTFRIPSSVPGQQDKVLSLRPGYSYREGNWEIGRAAERANVKIREYRRGNRFLAWRKRVARKAKVVVRKGAQSRGRGRRRRK